MYRESKLIPETVEHFVAENTKYKLKWQQYLLEMARLYRMSTINLNNCSSTVALIK